MIIYYSFIALLFIIIIKGEKIVLGNINVVNGVYYAFITLNDKVEIDLSNNYTWLTDNIINRSLLFVNENCRDIAIYNNNIEGRKIHNGNEYYGNVKLFNNKIKINKFHLYIVDNNYYNRKEGRFGFSLEFNNKNFSIVHQLKRMGLIKHLRFGFSPIEKSNGLIYLGGITKNIRESSEKFVCIIPNILNQWGCDLKRLIFDSNIIYNNTFPTIFNSINGDILIPMSFLNYFLYKVIHRASNCYMAKRQKFFSFWCNKKEIEVLPNVIIEFKGFHLEVEFVDIFQCKNLICESILKYALYNSNNWIFGINFFKKFYIQFDYEDRTITFFNQKNFVQKGINIIAGLYWVNIILLTLYLLFIIIFIKDGHCKY